MASHFGKVVEGSLAFRSGPGKTYSSIATLQVGTVLALTFYDYYWSETTYNGSTGYVMNRWIQFTSGYGMTGAQITSANGNPVNIRPDPSTSQPALFTLPVGTSVGVLQAVGTGWKQISCSKGTGFIMNEFLTTSGGGSGSNLKEGDSGPAVLRIQERLLALKYYIGTSGADSDFGPSTTAGVKFFQQRNGLTADGIVGPNTDAALFGTSPALGFWTNIPPYNKSNSIWSSMTDDGGTCMAILVSSIKSKGITPHFLGKCDYATTYFDGKATAFGLSRTAYMTAAGLNSDVEIERNLTSGVRAIVEFPVYGDFEGYTYGVLYGYSPSDFYVQLPDGSSKSSQRVNWTDLLGPPCWKTIWFFK